MASLEQYALKNGTRWLVRYRAPNGNQSTKRGFTTKKAAQNWANHNEVRKVDNTWIDPALGKITIGELCDQWIDTKVNLKPSSLARYRHSIEQQVKPQWQDRQVATLTTAEIQTWVTGMVRKKELSPSTIRKAHHVLSLVCAMAVRDRRIISNPAREVSLPRLARPENTYLTAQEVQRLADAAGEYRLAVLVLAYCGLRWGEMTALRVKRVDPARRRLRVAEAATEVDGVLTWGTPKSHASRTVPLPASLAEELREHIKGKGPDDLLFTIEGRPMRNRSARRAWWDKAVAAAGLEDVTPHDLRHTAASLAISAGANVKAVQRMLGHATAVMTLDTYAELFPDDLDEVAERMDAMLAKVSLKVVS